MTTKQGIVSSMTSLAFHYVEHMSSPYRTRPVQSHGASGAVYGCLSFFAACYPRTTFLLFFVVPVPAWVRLL